MSHYITETHTINGLKIFMKHHPFSKGSILPDDYIIKPNEIDGVYFFDSPLGFGLGIIAKEDDVIKVSFI